jgi:TrmH family RNA methyltransferase
MEVHDIDEASFNKLSQTMHAQGVVAVVNRRVTEGDPFEIIKQMPRCLWVGIDRMHDPGNLGSIMRTAEWLGIDGILVGQDCVEIFNPKVVRSSMGAIFHLPIHQIADLPELLRRLQQFGCFTYAADQAGDFPYTSITYAAKKILLLGDEADGLSEQILEVTQHRVAIPRKGHGESLNVAIAAAIVLAEMVR